MSRVETHWTLGVLIGLPVLSVVVLALLGFAAGCVYFALCRDVDDEFIQYMGAGVSGVAALVLVVFMALGYWPYNSEYHQWRPVQGTVTHVDSRITTSGDGISQRYVIQFAGSNTPYGCDDTRCATVRPGDALSLSCVREWQWAANSGYGCRWVDIKRAEA